MPKHEPGGLEMNERLASGQRGRFTPADPGQVLLAATAADVDTVVVGGDAIVADGRHRLGDTGRLLALSIDELRSAG